MTNSSTTTRIEPGDIWAAERPTPLLEMPALAGQIGVRRVLVKLEGERPLSNFKALGGMLAGLRVLAAAVGARSLLQLHARVAAGAALPTLVCASDGNHGLAVAAAAHRVGGSACIYLPDAVSQVRAERIRAQGAAVVRVHGTYDDAVQAAAAAAQRGEGVLIADTSSDPDDPVVADVMAGYALLAAELTTQCREQIRDRPSHLFIQAGVGGLAAAMAQGLRDLLRQPARLLVVEPERAACVARALAAGHPVRIHGDLHTVATMLSCGLASAPALVILQQHGARSILVSEDELQAAVGTLLQVGGPPTTASGAAGLAGLLQVAADPQQRIAQQLDQDSTVLLIATEGPLAPTLQLAR